MRNLFGLTGKALSFLTSRCEGEHFVLNHGGELRTFLETASSELAQLGEVDYATADIEGCFPNMPKEAIKMGLRKQLKEHPTGDSKRTRFRCQRTRIKKCTR